MEMEGQETMHTAAASGDVAGERATEPAHAGLLAAKLARRHAGRAAAEPATAEVDAESSAALGGADSAASDFRPDFGVADLGGVVILGNEIKHSVQVVNAGSAPAGAKLRWTWGSVTGGLEGKPLERSAGTLIAVPTSLAPCTVRPVLEVQAPGKDPSRFPAPEAQYDVQAPKLEWMEMAAASGGGGAGDAWKLKPGESMSVIAGAKGAKYLQLASDALKPAMQQQNLNNPEASSAPGAAFKVDGSWSSDGYTWTVKAATAGAARFSFRLGPESVGPARTLDVEATIDGTAFKDKVQQAHIHIDVLYHKLSQVILDCADQCEPAYEAFTGGVNAAAAKRRAAMNLPVDLILGIALAGFGGLIGGGVGGAVKGPIDAAKKAGMSEIQAGAITDLLKDIAKGVSKDVGKLALPETVKAAPTGNSAAAHIRQLQKVLHAGVAQLYELLLKIKAASSSKTEFTTDPEAIVLDAIKGIEVPKVIPSDEYEEGLWAAWLGTYGWRCSMNPVGNAFELQEDAQYARGAIDAVAKRRGSSYEGWLARYAGLVKEREQEKASKLNKDILPMPPIPL